MEDGGLFSGGPLGRFIDRSTRRSEWGRIASVVKTPHWSERSESGEASSGPAWELGSSNPDPSTV